MSQSGPPSIIAVSVGNTSVRLGRFEPTESESPRPSRRLRLDARSLDVATLANWSPAGKASWFVSSVFREADERLRDWVVERDPTAHFERLTADHFPIHLDIDNPELVGTDRLAAAVAANELRGAGRAAIVVDAGTAITVDAVDSRGVFRGGSILAGHDLAAWALNQLTDQLPKVNLRWDADESPNPVGRDTHGAICSGLYWGAVGAVRELVRRVGDELGCSHDLFLTGGAAIRLAAELGPAARVDEDLVLNGVMLAAGRRK